MTGIATSCLVTPWICLLCSHHTPHTKMQNHSKTYLSTHHQRPSTVSQTSFSRQAFRRVQGSACFHMALAVQHSNRAWTIDSTSLQAQQLRSTWTFICCQLKSYGKGTMRNLPQIHEPWEECSVAKGMTTTWGALSCETLPPKFYPEVEDNISYGLYTPYFLSNAITTHLHEKPN